MRYIDALMVVLTLGGVYYVCSGSTRRLVVGGVVLALGLLTLIMGAWYGVDASFLAAGRAMQ